MWPNIYTCKCLILQKTNNYKKVRFMVLNATFNNISVILVEETWIPGETTHLSQVTDNLSHNVVSSSPHLSRIQTHNVSGDSMPIYPLQRVFYPQNRPCTPKIVGTFYMQGNKVKEKTAIVSHSAALYPQFQISVGTLWR
jgi:hypothetical protein